MHIWQNTFNSVLYLKKVLIFGSPVEERNDKITADIMSSAFVTVNVIKSKVFSIVHSMYVAQFRKFRYSMHTENPHTVHSIHSI